MIQALDRIRLASFPQVAGRDPTLDWTQCSAVERIPGKVSGAWLFKDARVPVRALFENLASGATVDEFVEWFPVVTRTQVEAVLEHLVRSLAVEA
jgi:uncharacterized protein (DUF433 family)